MAFAAFAAFVYLTNHREVAQMIGMIIFYILAVIDLLYVIAMAVSIAWMDKNDGHDDVSGVVGFGLFLMLGFFFNALIFGGPIPLLGWSGNDAMAAAILAAVFAIVGLIVNVLAAVLLAAVFLLFRLAITGAILLFRRTA